MLFDRPEADDNAVLVHVALGRGPAPVDAQGRPRTDHLDEFAELARAAGARIVGTLETRREQPAPRYFVGTGKADELKALVSEREARLVIFDHDLSPAQERNLEAHLEARVLSRTGLILDIFAQRARTHECGHDLGVRRRRHGIEGVGGGGVGEASGLASGPG